MGHKDIRRNDDKWFSLTIICVAFAIAIFFASLFIANAVQSCCDRPIPKSDYQACLDKCPWNWWNTETETECMKECQNVK